MQFFGEGSILHANARVSAPTKKPEDSGKHLVRVRKLTGVIEFEVLIWILPCLEIFIKHPKIKTTKRRKHPVPRTLLNVQKKRNDRPQRTLPEAIIYIKSHCNMLYFESKLKTSHIMDAKEKTVKEV